MLLDFDSHRVSIVARFVVYIVHVAIQKFVACVQGPPYFAREFRYEGQDPFRPREGFGETLFR